MAGRPDSSVLVVWQHALSRRRYLIGHLSRDSRGHVFTYETTTPGALSEAQAVGFRLFDEFPAPEGEWRQPELFATFLRRVPQTWAAEDYGRLGVEPGDGIEFLRLTGGRLPTDTLEFLEPISAADTYYLRFPVAGWRYYDGEQVMEELVPGAVLGLQLDETNPHDPNAIRVLSPSGVHIGFVPAVYSWCLTQSVRRGSYRATVASLGAADDPGVGVIVDLDGDQGDLLGDQLVRYVPLRLYEYGEVVSA